MDQDRQIRFLIPPFFLYTSLLWWALIDPYLHCFLSRWTGGGLKEALPLVAALGGLAIPIGYSLGTLGMLLLKVCFHLRSRLRPPRQMYEAYVSDECFKTILRETAALGDNRSSLLYASATFDHELLPKGIHKWIFRRWSAFNVAFNSALAIIASFLVVVGRAFYAWPFSPYCGLSETDWRQAAGWTLGGTKFWWLVTNLSLLCVFCCAARVCWHETMEMIEFQARRRNVYELKKRK
jgi:hypothetical protein